MYCEPLFLFFNILSDQRLVDKTKPPMNVPTARSSIPYDLVTNTAGPVAAAHKGQWAQAGVNKIKENKIEDRKEIFKSITPCKLLLSHQNLEFLHTSFPVHSYVCKVLPSCCENNGNSIHHIFQFLCHHRIQ